MMLSRRNLVPVLAIIAGGAIGALLTFSPLVLWSPSDDVAEQMTAEARADAIDRAEPLEPVIAPGPRSRRGILIDSVAVEGNIRQADLTIISMGGLNRGSAYTIFDIRRATKSMWATGQFKDIRVRVEGDVGVGMVTLIWEVDERAEN